MSHPTNSVSELEIGIIERTRPDLRQIGAALKSLNLQKAVAEVNTAVASSGIRSIGDIYRTAGVLYPRLSEMSINPTDLTRASIVNTLTAAIENNGPLSGISSTMLALEILAPAVRKVRSCFPSLSVNLARSARREGCVFNIGDIDIQKARIYQEDMMTAVAQARALPENYAKHLVLDQPISTLVASFRLHKISHPRIEDMPLRAALEAAFEELDAKPINQGEVMKLLGRKNSSRELVEGYILACAMVVLLRTGHASNPENAAKKVLAFRPPARDAAADRTHAKRIMDYCRRLMRAGESSAP